MKRTRLAGAAAGGGAVVLVAALALRAGCDGGGARQPSAPELRAPPAAAPGVDAAAGAPALRSAAAPADEAGATVPAALAERLARAARAVESGDRAAAELELAGLVATRARVLEILAWLRQQPAPPPEPATSGALLALQAGLLLAAQDSAQPGFSSLEFVELVLRELALLDPGLRRRLIALLAGARTAAGPALDARHLRCVLELRRTHPELAEELGPLLEQIGSALGGSARDQDLRRLFLEGEDDPALVKAALASLLASEPQLFLALAEELFALNKDDARLRSAIVQAIVSAAPVDDAAAMLARTGSVQFLTQAHVLGTRPGGLEALAREYDRLLQADGNARGRELLVAGMLAESEPVLRGIARLDPDPQVRVQSLLTLSARGAVEASLIDELRALRASGGPAQGGISTLSSMWVAENVLARSPGAARDAAREYLSELVRDASLPESERWEAWRRVRAWLAPGALRGVTIGTQVLP